jgi:hypothetical protein
MTVTIKLHSRSAEHQCATLKTYQFHRAQGLNSVDACTDTAQLHGQSFASVAATVSAAGLADARLKLAYTGATA